jgi:hypothetical protein
MLAAIRSMEIAAWRNELRLGTRGSGAELPCDVQARLHSPCGLPHVARMVGLAPARRGQPGYYPQHDRDKDGIACEPWPRR